MLRDSLSAETTDFWSLEGAPLSCDCARRECVLDADEVEGGSTLMVTGIDTGDATELGRGTLTPVKGVF